MGLLFGEFNTSRFVVSASFFVRMVNHKYFEACWFGNFPLSFVRSVDILKRMGFFNGSFGKDSESRWFGHR